MTYPGLPMWNSSSKIHYFIDFWHPFCWRLWRPWMLLSTKSKGHKSKFRISWMYTYHFYELKVHFWWLNKRFFWCRSSLNTLYKDYCLYLKYLKSLPFSLNIALQVYTLYLFMAKFLVFNAIKTNKQAQFMEKVLILFLNCHTDSDGPSRLTTRTSF